MRDITASQARTRVCIAFLMVSSAAGPCLAAATGYEGFVVSQKAAVAPIQADYDKIAAAYAAKPQMRAYQGRLALLAQVVRVLCDSTESAMSDSLDDILGATPAPVPKQRSRAKMTTAPAAVMGQYLQRFADVLPLPEASDTEKGLLRKYYEKSFDAAEAYVAGRCKVFGAFGNNHIQAIELALVLPLLRTPDSGWSAGQIASLPKWLNSQQDLKVCETFALRVKRPRTAYAFMLRRVAAGEDKKEQTFLQYVPSQAQALIKAQDYAAAMAVLKEGISQAGKDRDAPNEVDLRLQLGDLLDLMGHPALAAEEAKQVWAKASTPGQAGRSAVLRLKWLYKAEQFQQVMAEAGEYQSDKRCAPYLPQIIYISWVAHRRENKTAQADRLQELFLKEFPQSRRPCPLWQPATMPRRFAGLRSSAIAIPSPGWSQRPRISPSGSTRASSSIRKARNQRNSTQGRQGWRWGRPRALWVLSLCT